MLLEEIVAHKRIEVQRQEQAVPIAELEDLVRQQSPPRDFLAALKGERVRLIAEIKRASPSKGPLCLHLDPINTARTYATNGAAAISVLTESRFFCGSIEDLRTIRKVLELWHPLPILRKDFILSPYQVMEARAYGADAILLIVAILTSELLRDLLNMSHSLGMECLVEVHDEEELERALLAGATIIGINNRDLRTFRVDLATTQRLRPLVPSDRLVVSESGIHTRQDVQRLQEWGVHAMLVGEALVTSPNVAAKVRELTGQEEQGVSSG